MRPKRTDNKYWTRTRNFNHIQYESDLKDYIIDLENENQQLRKNAVVSSSFSSESDHICMMYLDKQKTCMVCDKKNCC